MKIQSYKDLMVWQKSVELATLIYTLTSTFPKSEVFGLTSQMRRAAVSIPSNIAEGYARKHRAEYIQFVRMAYGSGAELETQLILAQRLKIAKEGDIKSSDAPLQEVMKMLNGLLSSLNPIR